MNKNKQTEFVNLAELYPSNGVGLIVHRKIEILDINETLAEMFGYDHAELRGGGMTILNLIAPEARGLVLRSTLVRVEQPYLAVGMRRDGSIFPIKILDYLVAGQDASTRAMVITNMTGQKQTDETLESLKKTRQKLEEKLNTTTTHLRYANERLQLELSQRVQIEAELRVRARQQAAVAELGQKALAGAELTALFNDAVASVAHILGLPYTAIFQLSSNKEKLILQAGQGWSPDLIGQATVDLQPDNPVDHALYTEETVILAGPETETCFRQSSLFSEKELNCGLNLAIHGYGVLGVYTTSSQTFTQDNLHFLQAMANILAAAIARKQTEAQIRASMQDKEVLLREIHHRVKNNLQVISSLINLQADHLVDQQALEALKASQNQICSMALVHEKLYRSENLAGINFGDYIRDVITHLFHAHNASPRGITLNIKIDDIVLDIDATVTCGLIINELVSNSLKHAFPNGQGGEIAIEMRQDINQQITLIMKDNGVGFPPNLDYHLTDSLGLKLVKMLVEQLDGAIELLPNPGTTFKISFASNQPKQLASN